jgi:hypothetical protein
LPWQEFDSRQLARGIGKPLREGVITKPAGVQAYTTGYAMRLDLGKEQRGLIPAKLYLCLPDERKSWIAGSFVLDLQ